MTLHVIREAKVGLEKGPVHFLGCRRFSAEAVLFLRRFWEDSKNAMFCVLIYRTAFFLGSEGREAVGKKKTELSDLVSWGASKHRASG